MLVSMLQIKMPTSIIIIIQEELGLTGIEEGLRRHPQRPKMKQDQVNLKPLLSN
jgi:hypothetical protein